MFRKFNGFHDIQSEMFKMNATFQLNGGEKKSQRQKSVHKSNLGSTSWAADDRRQISLLWEQETLKYRLYTREKHDMESLQQIQAWKGEYA